MQTPYPSTPELESSIYGSLAHTIEVLIDATSADAAVARVLGGPPIPGCVYIGSRGLACVPNARRELRRWPTDPQSLFKRLQEKTQQDTAWLLDTQRPENEPVRREITRAFAAPEPINGALCLMLDLVDQIKCMVLFVRSAEHPSFHSEDVDRVKSLAPAASHVIHKGLINQLQATGLTQPGRSTPVSINTLLERLSKTERRVLELLLRRDTEKQIAQTISRSPHTVHVHVKSIYCKLMVNSRKQLLEMLDGLTTHSQQPVDPPQQLAA